MKNGGIYNTPMIFVENPSFVTIENSSIYNSKGDEISGWLGDGSQDTLSFKKSIIINNMQDGISLYIRELANVLIQCNIIGANQRDGLRIEGLKGATKDQLKNMLEDAILKVTCGAISDLLVGVEGEKMLRNAIDRIINGLPNGVAAPPSWMMEQVASKLADLNPAIKWRKKFVECMKEIIDAFVNALREQVKKDADWLRAQYGGGVYAAKQNAEMDFLERTGGRYWGTQYGKHVKDTLETNPCNPPPNNPTHQKW